MGEPVLVHCISVGEELVVTIEVDQATKGVVVSSCFEGNFIDESICHVVSCYEAGQLP